MADLTVGKGTPLALVQGPPEVLKPIEPVVAVAPAAPPAAKPWAPGAATPKATLKTSADTAKGTRSAEATAALTALISGSKIDTSGTLSITNEQMTSAQFKAAIETVFGPNAKLTNGSSFTYSPASGISSSLVSSFQAVAGAMTLDSKGQLVLKGDKASGEVGGHVQKVLGSNTVLVGGAVRFKDNAFQSAELNRKLVTKFGKAASLTSTLKASVDREGATSAESAAALSALINGATIDTSTGLTITNKTLTKAQFSAALKHTLGPKAEVSGSNSFVWAKGADGKTTQEATAAFKAVHDSVQLDGSGKLKLKDGVVVSGELGGKLTKVLGTGTTLGAENTIGFKGTKVTSVAFTESLQKKYGDTASVGASVKTTFTEAGLTEAQVSLEAFKQLKTWGDAGHLDVTSKGTVVLKDGKVSTAEVEGMLSAVAGTDVKIGVGGKLEYAAGKPPRISEFSSSLSKAWGSTTVAADGKVKLVDGKPQASGHVSALVGGPALKYGADLSFEGADKLAVNAKLTSTPVGGNRTFETTAGIVREKDKTTITGQTKLVTTGDHAMGLTLGGLVSSSDTERAAQLKTELTAGGLSGALGVGVSSGVKLYTPGPAEPRRKAVAEAGGVWAERTNTYDLSAGAGVTAPIIVGPATVSLGFKANGEVKREVHVLSLHSDKEDALKEGLVTVIHPPDSVDAIRAMKPYEQFSDSGTQSLGMSGNVSVGYGVGPASISAGGQMYYQVTGNVARDIERLDGDKVRVRFRKQDDSVNVKAFSASVGLNGAKLLPANALGSAVAPLVESVAQVGFKASVEKTKQNGSMFEVELDLSTPRGRAAMEHLLKNDLSEAQYWARYADSGVKLNSSVTTALNVNTKSANLNLAGLDAESMTRWIEKAKTELTPDSYTFTQALDYTQKSNHLLPWMPSRMSDVRFLNQREVAVDASAMPPVGEAPAVGAPMTMRVAPPEPVATLANSRALLGVRVKITDSKSSLRDVNDTLGAAVNVMDAVGYTPEAYKRFSDFRTAVNAGIVPQKKALLLGLGDKRFGETSLDLEGYVGPQGLKTMFSRPDGMGRSRDDYNHAYLQAAGLTGDGSVASDAGLRAAIEKKLHASLVPQSSGGYSVVKEGTAIGTLSPADFAALRKTVDDFAPPMASDERPNWYQEVQAKVGTWVGKPPRALFDLDSQKWAEVTTTRGRASAFSDAMEKAAALSAENSPSNPTPGPLFDKPEAYFGQLNELFEKTVHNDGNHQTAALTLLTLAGKDGIYTRAAFTVPKETAGQMIDTARSAVQRFGAATLLADRQPTLNAAGAFEFATGSDPAAAIKLAQAMFGPGVKVQSSDGRTMVSDIAMTPERKEGLMTLLTAGRGADGSLQMPSKWSPAQTSRFIKDALGAPTVVSGGRIAFDNHGYQGVSIGDALSSFGPEAFGTHAPGKGPSRFAVSAPIENEHLTQDPSAYLQFMVAKHKGVNSGWGAAFEGMAFMRTRQADLSRAEPLATGWVLTD